MFGAGIALLVVGLCLAASGWLLIRSAKKGLTKPMSDDDLSPLEGCLWYPVGLALFVVGDLLGLIGVIFLVVTRLLLHQ